jgi:hypothetical protein
MGSGNRLIEKHPDMCAVSGTRTFHRHRHSDSLAGILHSPHVLTPVLLVQIDGQEPAGFIEQHRVNSGDKGMSQRILSREMPPDNLVGDGQEPLMPALAALDFRLFTNATNPFVAASRLVTRPAGLSAFEPAGIDIFASAKQGAKQADLFLS